MNHFTIRFEQSMAKLRHSGLINLPLNKLHGLEACIGIMVPIHIICKEPYKKPIQNGFCYLSPASFDEYGAFCLCVEKTFPYKKYKRTGFCVLFFQFEVIH